VSVRSRVVVNAGVILLLVTFVVAAVVEARLRSRERSRADTQLEALVETARQLEAHRYDRLTLQAELLSQMLPLSGGLNAADRQAVSDLVGKFAARPQTADLLLVLDHSGELVAASPGGQRLTGLVPIPAPDSSEPSLPEGVEPTRIALGGHLYAALVRPAIDPASRTAQAYVIVAEEIGARAAESLARLTHSEVVLLVDGKPMASTLPMGTDAEVERALPSVASGRPASIEIRGEPYLARLQSFSPTGTGATGRLLLTSLDPGAFPSRLSGQVILVGLSGMALGLPLLWLGGYRLQRALSHLSEAMAATATSGRLEHDLDAVVVDRWSAPEVGRLARSFQSLMRTVEQSLHDRERSYVEAVGAVVAAIDARDHETTGHSFRVAHYALALARRLDIEGEHLRAIEWGALLHDVGKIAVPDAILRKAGQLTAEEWHVMRQHPNWGFEMLADVQFLEPALEIVYSHHERWDGGGYPRGLEREETPLAARIFAVVDTYDSITSDRPYRQARSHAEAITELCRVAGTQLDPDVVEAFIRIPEVELRRLRERSSGLNLSARIPDAITELPAAGAYYGA